MCASDLAATPGAEIQKAPQAQSGLAFGEVDERDEVAVERETLRNIVDLVHDLPEVVDLVDEEQAHNGRQILARVGGQQLGYPLGQPPTDNGDEHMEWTRTVLEEFDRWSDAHGDQFRQAEPFPHAVIDGLFDPAILRNVLQEFPDHDSAEWDRSEDPGIQVKLRSNWKADADIASSTRELVHFLNSGVFLDRVTSLTGIERLISDPYYTGGGLNCILPGGLLDVHCDGNWHDRMGVHRRLNAILYLNEEWQPEWGGAFELWNQDMSACVESILPAFNRLIIFETHDFSYHGHPTPLACPPGRSRKSVIVYYYTSTQRPADQVLVDEPHRALWRSKDLNPLS